MPHTFNVFFLSGHSPQLPHNLVPWPGVEPMPSAVKVWSPNQWTTREFPYVFLKSLHNAFVKNPPAVQETTFDSWVRKILWRRARLPTPYSWSSLVAQLVKNPPAMREIWVRLLGWEDSPGEEKGYPLQYSGLENSMDYTAHGVAESRTRLIDFPFHFHNGAASSDANGVSAFILSGILTVSLPRTAVGGHSSLSLFSFLICCSSLAWRFKRDQTTKRVGNLPKIGRKQHLGHQRREF